METLILSMPRSSRRSTALVWSKGAVGDEADPHATLTQRRHHVEELLVEEALAFALQLDVFEIVEGVEGREEGVVVEVFLRHVATTAEAAREVASRGGLDLHEGGRGHGGLLPSAPLPATRGQGYPRVGGCR